MDTKTIIAEIDAELSRLQSARAILAGTTTTNIVKPTTRKRRKLSAKARKAIADAQRARWAKVRAKAK